MAKLLSPEELHQNTSARERISSGSADRGNELMRPFK
jgi:hypothetical protein